MGLAGRGGNGKDLMHYILEEWELKGEKEEGGGREFRLKESVFYNLFLFLFDIIEILIMKIKYFSKIYKFYTPFFKVTRF